jgi:hypothetical protein
MGRATWSEAIGAGQKVLLIDGFQHHRHRSLSDLVLEGRDAERPLRTIRLWNVGPTDRRCLIPARLEAIEEVTKIGLQVRLIDRRRNTVDAGGPILAGEPVGLLHPVHIDDMVQRVQRLSAPSPRQFGYPLSFGGQVRRVQCPLPCFRSAVLSAWRLPSLDRVPASPVPRLQRYYEGATTSRVRLPGPLWIRFRAPRAPPCSCSPWRSRSGEGPLSGPGTLVSRSPLSGGMHVGMHGISQVSWRSILHLCPALRPRPDQQVLALIGPADAAPGTSTPRAPAKYDLGAQPRALVSAAYASRAALPPPMQGSLPAGGLQPLPGGSRTLWNTMKGFRLHPSSFPGLLLTQTDFTLQASDGTSPLGTGLTLPCATRPSAQGAGGHGGGSAGRATWTSCGKGGTPINSRGRRRQLRLDRQPA